MRLKSLVVTDGVGNFENVDMVAASKRIQDMFPDYKIWKVTNQDGDVYYVNSLYVSSFQIDEGRRRRITHD